MTDAPTLILIGQATDDHDGDTPWTHASVRNADEAIRAVRSHKPKAVLLQVTGAGQLPTSLAVIRAVRGRWPRMPVFACSGRASEAVERGVRSAGVSAYLGTTEPLPWLLSMVPQLEPEQNLDQHERPPPR